MSQQPTSTILGSWVSNIHAYFNLPNPKIFTLFIISSTATFSLGIAMIVEWTYHGRYHPGYDWIVCYAPVMIALPILSWIICLSSAIAFNKGQVKLLLPVTDQSQLEQPRDEEMQPLSLALHDQQPEMVQVQPVHDHTSDLNSRRAGINMEYLNVKTDNKDDTKALKRSCSLSVPNTTIDNSKIKRTSSF